MNFLQFETHIILLKGGRGGMNRFNRICDLNFSDSPHLTKSLVFNPLEGLKERSVDTPSLPMSNRFQAKFKFQIPLASGGRGSK